MNTRLKNRKWTALAVLLVAGASAAEGERVDFDFNAGIGSRYDSNVALVELDNSAGEADTATEFEAGAGFKIAVTDALSLKLAYAYSGTSHRNFTEFDLDLHHGHAALMLQKGRTDTAFAFDRFEGVLDGDDYLVHSQAAASVSRLFGERWYLRGAYTRAQKAFAGLESRDSRSDAFRGDAYFLIDGMNHFIAVGVQSMAEDASDDTFDFGSTMGQLSWGYRMQLQSTDIEFRARIRLEQREYAGAIPESGDIRIDDRLRIRLSATVPFTEHVSVGASIERTRNQSNQPAANLDRNVYAVQLGVAF